MSSFQIVSEEQLATTPAFTYTFGGDLLLGCYTASKLIPALYKTLGGVTFQNEEVFRQTVHATIEHTNKNACDERYRIVAGADDTRTHLKAIEDRVVKGFPRVTSSLKGPEDDPVDDHGAQKDPCHE